MAQSLLGSLSMYSDCAGRLAEGFALALSFGGFPPGRPGVWHGQAAQTGQHDGSLLTANGGCADAPLVVAHRVWLARPLTRHQVLGALTSKSANAATLEKRYGHR